MQAEPTTRPETARLDAMRGGHCAQVQSVDASSADILRLMSFGVCAGQHIAVIQQGDPMIIEVLGTRVGISARLANHVSVEPCAAPCPLLHLQP